MRFSLMILDFVASIILFVIAFGISRPIALIRRRLSLSPQPSSASSLASATALPRDVIEDEEIEEGEEHCFPLASSSFGSGMNWNQFRAS